MGTFKKTLIYSLTVCAIFCLLGTAIAQPLQTVMAEDILHDDHFGCQDNFGRNASSDKSSCYIPEANRGSSNLTREEEGRLACMPEFITPDHIALQGKEDNDGEQRGTNPLPIKALILIDEEAEAFYDELCQYEYGPYYYGISDEFKWSYCEMWTRNILECGDDYMTSQYGIEFIAWRFEPWVSNNTANYYDLLDELYDTVNPTSYGCSVVVLMSGQDGYNDRNQIIYGCSFIDGAPYFVMNINISYGGHVGWHTLPLDYLFAHETSHLFNCWDHSHGLSTPCCIMCNGACVSKSTYCPTCNSAMQTKRFRFDSAKAGYVTDVISYFESPNCGAYVINRPWIIGSASNGYYTSFCSGSYNPSLYNKAVLNVQMNPTSSAVSGTVYVRAYSGSSLGNHLMIFKSLDGVNWAATPILNTNFYSPGTPIDINCGYVSNFKYFSIVVLNDYNYIGTVHIDSIHVHS